MSVCGWIALAGSTSHASRQFFPYVSSETDLQRYKAISFRNCSNNEPRSNSSISNIPSDLKSDKIKVSNPVFHHSQPLQGSNRLSLPHDKAFSKNKFDWNNCKSPLKHLLLSFSYLPLHLFTTTSSNIHYTRRVNTSRNYFQSTRHTSSNMGEKVAQVCLLITFCT